MGRPVTIADELRIHREIRPKSTKYGRKECDRMYIAREGFYVQGLNGNMSVRIHAGLSKQRNAP